eukprot:evm.model.scf_1584.2 EVM.evm.TU.scf_1584.2   scf_1584:3672-4666(-)
MDVDDSEAASPEEPLPLPFAPSSTADMRNFEVEAGTYRTPAAQMVPVHWTAVAGEMAPGAGQTPCSAHDAQCQPATPIYLISNFHRNWNFTRRPKQKQKQKEIAGRKRGEEVPLWLLPRPNKRLKLDPDAPRGIGTTQAQLCEYLFARVELRGVEEVEGAGTAREPPDVNHEEPNQETRASDEGPSEPPAQIQGEGPKEEIPFTQDAIERV